MDARAPRHWITWFALTLAACIALALWATLRIPSFRDPAVDFYAMKPGEYFNTLGLTRRQSGSVKLGFAEHYAPPPIGAFGNHIINFLGADAFGAPESAETFFNYSYANLSLPEMLRMMRHLEVQGRLPTKLIIVQITPPNADNGAFIIDRGNELPPDVMLGDLFDTHHRPSFGEAKEAAWETLEVRLHEVLNYNTFILGLLQNTNTPRMTGPAVCAASSHLAHPPNWTRRLPWTLRAALDPSGVADPCTPDSWQAGIRRDGSGVLPPKPDLVRDADPLRENERKLHAGDEFEIAQTLRDINAIGARHGIKTVFLIPPVYETDRKSTVVNQIMDRALARAPELTVIDDRGEHDDPTLFSSYLHPSPKYFARLVGEMRARGLLDEPGMAMPTALPAR